MLTFLTFFENRKSGQKSKIWTPKIQKYQKNDDFKKRIFEPIGSTQRSVERFLGFLAFSKDF